MDEGSEDMKIKKGKAQKNVSQKENLNLKNYKNCFKAKSN